MYLELAVQDQTQADSVSDRVSVQYPALDGLPQQEYLVNVVNGIRGQPILSARPTAVSRARPC